MHPDGCEPGQTFRLRLKDLPIETRPRERLVTVGSRALSDAELLAILLGSGSPGETALGLAERLLARFGAPGVLASAHPEQLIGLEGVGPAKAARLLAACELGRRMVGAHPGERPFVRCAADLAALAEGRLRWEQREHALGVWLNARNQVLGQELVAIGHLTEAPLHPRELFRLAMQAGAAAIALVHNHPSGDPSPSEADRNLTRRLVAVGVLVGIPLIDHVIVASGGHYSFRTEPGLWTEAGRESAP